MLLTPILRLTDIGGRLVAPYVFKDNTRNCAQCEVRFRPKRNDARYCGQVCAIRGRKGRPHHRACGDCGIDITGRMGNAKFCRECGTIRDRERMYAGTCCKCGGKFEASSRRQKYCGRGCGGKSSRAAQLAVIHLLRCTACNMNYTTNDPRRKQCGTACKQWSVKYPDVIRLLDRECKHCLTPFRASTAARRYCRTECSARAGKIRRRAQEAGAFIEEVSKGVVARRDNWRCQLCRKRVDPKLRHPHPMSWSLDHIIPISRGGEHSYANTQLAHLGCNVSKGARITTPTQLALIG